jgi:hypothetical protein
MEPDSEDEAATADTEASIQALQQTKHASTFEGLVANVDAAFRELDVETLDNVFYSWMQCMEQIMLSNGDNDYKIPHIGKQRLRSLGLLPRLLPCSNQAVAAARAFLATPRLI